MATRYALSSNAACELHASCASHMTHLAVCVRLWIVAWDRGVHR